MTTSYKIYLDESGDRQTYVVAALIIPSAGWFATLRAERQWRQTLYQSDGIWLYDERHATDWVRGAGLRGYGRKRKTSGSASSPPPAVSNHRRAELFHESLAQIGTWQGVRVLGCVGLPAQKKIIHQQIFYRIAHWLQTQGAVGTPLPDDGQRPTYQNAWRVLNASGSFPGVLHPPVFLDSQRSYLTQAADFCAYALLRQEVPHPSHSPLISQAFARLRAARLSLPTDPCYAAPGLLRLP